MKKYTYLIIYIIIIVSNSVYAQKQTKHFKLIWKDNNELTTISSKKNEKIIVPIVKGNPVNENLLPTYSQKWKIKNNRKIKSYQISNIIYENIKKSAFQKESQNNLPIELQENFEIKYAKDVAYAVIHIIPLKINNGKLQRIKSFDLTYEFISTTKRFATKSSVHDSPLSSGTWYKFAVDTTGVYKISRAFLNSLGINTRNINPKNIKIYGNGGEMLPELNGDFRYDDLQENAIYIEGESDDSFDSGDYILFYAKGPDAWKYNSNNNISHHKTNIYSDKAHYFITVANDYGKRIENASTLNSNTFQTITESNDYRLYEKDLENFDSMGQDFFGENFQIQEAQNFTIPFTDLDITKPIQIEFRVGSISLNPSSFQLRLNDQDILSRNLNAISGTSIASIGKNNTTVISNSEILNFEVIFNNGGIPSAKGYLDYIEINGIKKLIARDKQYSFRNYIVNTQNGFFKLQIESPENIFQIWDVSDFLNPKNILNIGNSTTFDFLVQGGQTKEFILINNNDFYAPERIPNSKIENQNIHAIQDIDYLIITPNELKSQAERLANYHQQNSNFNTLILTPEIIYNEFSSGSQDITAIRDFIKHLYINASTPQKRIKYVLLFGDTSFDFKNIEGNSDGTNVISFQSKNSFNNANSYVTDDYFGMMDDNEGDFTIGLGSQDLQDVATGRLPVKNTQEARIAIDKILNYYSNISLGKWRNKITLIADDVDNKGYNFALQKNTERIADSIKSHKPVYNLNKLYADSYRQVITAGGERYPELKNDISNSVEQGSLAINFFGHGGENGWANERFLDIDQINSWFNDKNSPLFITVTCEFSRLDNPTRTTAGEYVFNNPNGGSINMITTSRAVYITSGGNFNRDLVADLLEFDGTHNYTIAEALMKTKNDNAGYGQRLFILYFGDPAMKLPIHKPNVKITEMNGVAVTQQLDTIKALSHSYFKGIITDANNNLQSDFNGELFVEIYDKSIDVTTLNNDNSIITYTDANGVLHVNQPAFMEFDTRQSKIFNGRASIENGQWEFDFIAPRDIRIAYGSAKLSFYAHNNDTDKTGYSTDVIIGGINENAPVDDVGPTIQLYMNDESFIDGGNTNQSPLFLAILEDDSGINTSFTAVDHDIIAILDGDVSNPIIMNDYYETELNDFTKGKVKFPFRNLEVGEHTITFKCWDTYNNSSEASLNFVVVSDTDLILDNVLNYPNPFINYTEFWFNHNKPNEALEVQIQIFTISGKLIKTINQNILTNGTLSRTISWNGLDDFGNKIGKGVYIYKLQVKTVSSGIKAEKFEKLVILQ